MQKTEEIIASEIKVEFCRRVIPSDIFRFLSCITQQDIEKVQAVEKNDGPTKAAEILHQRLTRRPGWLECLRQALLEPDVGLVDFGEELNRKCVEQTQLTPPPSDEARDTEGHAAHMDPSTIIKGIIIENRQDKIGSEIKEEFCKRVIPSDIIRYLTCLTPLDLEKVEAEERNSGAIIAAHLLHKRLVRRPDWLNDLSEALLNPDVGLTDFGERVDQKLRQIKVIVDAPGVCIDGRNCGEEHTSGTELALSPGESELEQAMGDSATNKESPGEIRQRLKLKVFDLLFRDIKEAKDLPETISYGESICTRLDKILHKCIEITFRMETVEKLDAFWELYKTGGLVQALSRDILTPERKQQMIENAKREGVELDESDFSLQVYIDENDYIFVKDTLLNKNAPLLARNTVESVLLHGRDNQQYTQEQKNISMRTFRRLLPRQFLLAFDDPFVQTFIPEYFAELSNQDPFQSAQWFYRVVTDKLKQQLSSPLSYHLSNVAYILAGTNNLEGTFSVNDENVVISTTGTTWSIPTDMWQHCLKYFRINVNKVQFGSELSLANFAFNCYDGGENLAKLQKLEFFTFVAGALYNPDKMASLIETYKLTHTYLAEYLYLRWLCTGILRLDQIKNTPSLVIPITKDTKMFLSNASQNGCRVQLLLHLPPEFQILVSGGQPLVPEPTIRSGDQPLPPIVLLRSTEGESKVLTINNDTSIDKQITFPESTDNILSYVLPIAHAVNILGSGKVKVIGPSNKKSDFAEKEEYSRASVIHFEILPRRQVNKDELDDKTQQLEIHLASYQLNDKDIDLLTDAFLNGLELSHINLTGTGLTGKQLSRFCHSAITSNITQLILSDNDLKFDEDINETGLGRLVSLELLEMRNCHLNDGGMKKLKKDILALKKLRAVDFSKNQLTANGLVILCTALRNSVGIRALRIHENPYQPGGGYILAMFLESLEFLEILNICYCNFGDEGITAIAKTLKAKNIKKINIRSNSITQKGTSALLKCFATCRHLNHFEYGENDIGFSHGVMFGKSDDLSKLFLDMLDSSKRSMEYLGLWKCGLGKTSTFNDSKVLRKLTELTEIVLQGNELEDIHAMSIGESLPCMANLQTISLRSNDIGPEGANYLARGIEQCPSLRTVVLDRNKINDFDALQNLAEVSMRTLKCLKTLDISYNVEMIAVARDHPKYMKLISTFTDILPNATVKEDELQTCIKSDTSTIFI